MSDDIKKNLKLLTEGQLNEVGEDADYVKLSNGLMELEEMLNEVVYQAKQLSRESRGRVSGPFDGQLRAYFIPWMTSWIEDENQPGSIATLRRILDAEKDQSEYEDPNTPIQ